MMTADSDDRLTIDGPLFDLLVDGELDPVRRDELLLRLDSIPDGWRRCALAFLEAQAWRCDLLAAVAAPATTKSRPAEPAAPARSRFARTGRFAVLALAVLMAFGAGWLTRPVGERPGGERSGGFGAGDRALESLPNLAHSVADSDKGPANDSGQTTHEADKHAPQFSAEMHMAGVLMLQVDDHGKTREVQVPVLDASGIDVRRLLEQSPAGRSAAVQALERRGHKVETHRQLLTVDLKDGRKLFVPIDQVDVRSANRVYQ